MEQLFSGVKPEFRITLSSQELSKLMEVYKSADMDNVEFGFTSNTAAVALKAHDELGNSIHSLIMPMSDDSKEYIIAQAGAAQEELHDKLANQELRIRESSSKIDELSTDLRLAYERQDELQSEIAKLKEQLEFSQEAYLAREKELEQLADSIEIADIVEACGVQLPIVVESSSSSGIKRLPAPEPAIEAPAIEAPEPEPAFPLNFEF